MQTSSGQRWRRPLGVISLLLIMFAAGYAIRPLIEKPAPPHVQIRQDGYRYIHPLLECDVREAYAKGHPDLPDVERALQGVIEKQVAGRAARTVGVYFRDLRSGVWFGINQHETFTPASLMKVPLMIAVLKKAEHDPSLLDRKIRYQGGEDTQRFQHVKPPESLQPGALYTVDDLLFRTIAFSDNESALLLADHFGMSSIEETLADLGIPLEQGKTGIMNVQSFSAFFRVLFNASYLDDHLSDRALGYLARSSFDKGIRGGLPKEMVVASKFGEYSAGENELHEFGIVYYPDHPYLLGIVTKGGTTESLPQVIQEISGTVYREIHRQHGR